MDRNLFTILKTTAPPHLKYFPYLSFRMDVLSTKWLSEMELDGSTFNHQWQHMSSFENQSFDIKPIPSTTNITTYDHNHFNNNCASQITQKSWKIGDVVDISSSNDSSFSTIISFGNSELERVEKNLKASPPLSSFLHHRISNLEEIYASLEYGGMKRGANRTPGQAQEHVLAERKRREKMTRKFVALSTLIPGLRKLDKATVLEDAINYIKELKERANDLEAEVKGKHNEEAIIVGAVKRPRSISSYDKSTSSSGENNDGCISSIVFGGSNHEISPEVEVRSSDGNVMVRVYCKNQMGVVKEAMGEIEKHNLTMISSSVMPFGENLHMTITAQMDAESKNLTGKHFVDNLRKSILNFV